MSSVEVCPVCDIAGCHHIRDKRINALGLIDLIGEFAAAVDQMIDDCETSGPVGAEVHTIEGHHLDKVSELLERIEALPFEEPGVILGPGAMLQAALLAKSIDAKAAVGLAVEKAAERLDANRSQLNFAEMLGLLRDEPLPEQIVSALSDWLDVIADAIRGIAPEDVIAEVAKLRERTKKSEAALAPSSTKAGELQKEGEG